MASRETLVIDAPLSELAADINTDPKMRAAWLEVAAARMAAQLMRTTRRQRGLSQEALARALDISQARISQIESGRVEDIPSLELLMRFIDACGDELILSANAPEAGVKAHPARTKRVPGRKESARPQGYGVAAPITFDDVVAEATGPRRYYADD